MRILFLGTGTSYGVPVIGCSCDVCTSSSDKNKRLRCSLLVSYNDKNILIDTPPDLRTQLLSHNITHIDSILFTHYHADHILGLDDVRILNKLQGCAIPCYGPDHTISTVRSIFSYAFDPSTPVGGGLPQLTLNRLSDPLPLFGQPVRPVHIMHGTLPIVGYTWKSFAYVTDCSYMPEESISLLRNIPVLVLNGLRYRKHSTHYSIGEAVDVINAIQPRKAYLTHISHDVDYHNLRVDLPDNIELAYDGLSLDVTD